MSYIQSVDIDGFWTTKVVHIEFNRDLNFLIGRNGIGKTTVINIISAILRGDVAAIHSAPFEHALIKLRAVSGNKRPVVEVKKEVMDEALGIQRVVFNVKERSRGSGKQYTFGLPLEERHYREIRWPRHRRFHEERIQLRKVLSRIVEVNWLSVHRGILEGERRGPRDEGSGSTVDQKLSEISRAFSNYFSLLSSKAETKNKSFQEKILLSLLDQELGLDDIFRQLDEEPADKATVVNVLRELGVSNAKATKSVTRHLSRLSSAKEKWKEQEVFGLEDAITLSDARRVDEMLEQWRSLQVERHSIFRPRTQFEAIVNELFSGKQLYFDARNIPNVQLESREEIPIDALSSGEKQLFILLGETLLQEERPVVFISDEPELSLHVNWQSCLFRNIRKINERCQVISATHSPDIVGGFQDRIIRMEECIRNV